MVRQVQTFLAQQRAVNSAAPRVIYGRNNAEQQLKPHEVATNAAAVTLLENDPSLLTFEGSILRTGPLIDAAKKVVAASGFSYAKPSGSRAAGIAGALGKRQEIPKSKMERQDAAKQKTPRMSGTLRYTQLETLPRQIVDLDSKLEDQRKRRQQLSARGQGEDFSDAITLSTEIEKTQKEVDTKKALLRDLTIKEANANKDKGNRTAGNGQGAALAVPKVTKAGLPHLSDAELAIADSLAEQLNNTQSFERAATFAQGMEGNVVCRVSPIVGISCNEYLVAASALRDAFQFDDGVNFLIKACTLLIGEQGHMTLKDLWKAAGGASSAGSSAQKMIDRLMHAPLVCVRIGVGGAHDAAWVVTMKEEGVNYSKLGRLMLAIEPPSLLAASVISKDRLRALKRLASTPADCRLLELAALDQASVRATERLSGRWHNSAPEQLERERQLYAALETFRAHEELAAMDTLAEISALLGGDEIQDAELRAEVEKLKVYEEARESEAAFEPGCLMDPQTRYEAEDVGAALQEVCDFEELLQSCTQEQADRLAEQMQAAAREAGVEIQLDSQCLNDAGKQEELVQIFGEGWDDALRSCLEPGDTSEVWMAPEEDTMEEMEHETLMDRAEDLIWEVKCELGGAEEGQLEEGQEEGAAELMLLAQMSPTRGSLW